MFVTGVNSLLQARLLCIVSVYPIAFYGVEKRRVIFEILSAVVIQYREWRSEYNHTDDAR
jgi:hypothetical protein